MRLVPLLLAILFFSACKPAAPESAALKDDSSGVPSSIEVCKCNDLACWKKETNQRSVASFKCAKDAIGTAFPVADIVLSLGTGAYDIYEATTELKTAIAVFKEGAKLASLVKEFAPPCVAGIAEHVGAIETLAASSLEAVDKFKGLSEKTSKGELDMSGVVEAMKAVQDPVEAITKLVTSASGLAKCLEDAKPGEELAEAKTAMTKIKETLLKAQKPWSELSPKKKLDIAEKGIKCGIAIVKGVNALAQNTLCLAEDFAEIDRQRAAIGRALAYDGTRLLNHARWAGCGYCLTTRRIGAAKNAEECKTCCRAPSNNPLPEWEPTKKGEWAEQCVSVCSAAYTEGVFVNYTDTRVCKERFEAASRDEAGHVFRYIDLLDAGERQKPKADQTRIAQEYRGKAIAHIDTIKASFAQFDANRDGLISLDEMKAKANAQGAVGEAARFYGTETIVRQDEINANDLPYVKASVGKPYFFVLLETATNGGGNNADQYDDLVGTTDLDAFKAEIGQYKTEGEIAP